MGTNTDPYQPVEGRYRLTQGIVETLADAGNPFSILTKSTLIGRDADLLADAARRHGGAHGAVDRLPGRGRVAPGRAPHARTRCARMETVAQAQRGGRAVRRDDRAGAAGHLRRPGSDRGGGEGGGRGRGHLDHPDHAPPAPRGARALPGVAGAPPGRSWPRPPTAATRAPTARPTSGATWRAWCAGWSPRTAACGRPPPGRFSRRRGSRRPRRSRAEADQLSLM